MEIIRSARPNSSAAVATDARSARCANASRATSPDAMRVVVAGTQCMVPSRRVGSSEGTGVTVTSVEGTAWTPDAEDRMYRSAPTAAGTAAWPAGDPTDPLITSTGATAAVTSPMAMRSNQSTARPDSNAASSGAARPVVSMRGSGNADRPASSSSGTRSRRSSPRPPRGSGTVSPTTPISAKVVHRSVRAAGASNAARKSSGVHSLVRTWRTASRNSVCCSVKANRTVNPPDPSGPRQPEQALGHHVPLDFVGAGVDRTGQCEQEAVEPRIARHSAAPGELGLGSEQPQRGAMDSQAGLGPVDLVGAGLGANGSAGQYPAGGPVGIEPVRLGIHPRLGHRVGSTGRPGRVAVKALGIERDQSGCRFGIAGRAAEAQTAFGAGGGHGHTPALADAPEHLRVGNEDALEEDLCEPGLTVDLGDRPHGHPGGVHGHQKVGEAPMAFGAGLGTEETEAPFGVRPA